MLEFYVKDTGIGIAKERQKAVFSRFVQADIEDKQVYEGSGLGLVISKAYVEMLGGKIWVEGEEGIGSTFYFTIPCDANSKEIHEKNTKDSNEQLLTKKGLKVLIVDDDEFVITYLRKVLEAYKKDMLVAKKRINCWKLSTITFKFVLGSIHNTNSHFLTCKRKYILKRVLDRAHGDVMTRQNNIHKRFNYASYMKLS